MVRGPRGKEEKEGIGMKLHEWPPNGLELLKGWVTPVGLGRHVLVPGCQPTHCKSCICKLLSAAARAGCDHTLEAAWI